jgi:hypothetical protein
MGSQDHRPSDRVETDIDLFADDYIVNPYPYHATMRNAAPVFWLANARQGAPAARAG